MNTLVTQAELLGDLAQRASRQLEPAYRPVELDPGDVGSLLSVEGASLRGPGLTQQERCRAACVYRTGTSSARPRSPLRGIGSFQP